MSYFVTGTDTNVGKTLISCALLHAFAAQGLRVVGMKPVACGCDDDQPNEDVKQLRAASNILASYGQINPYNFYYPIAPHIAARNAGVRIEFARILTCLRELASQADEIIVEGVGGFVLPGDHVDVSLTRQIDKSNASSEVVLQNVRVLAIDQIADERTEKPSVVKAVTLEVDVVGAQKLSLAASVGSLSLMLRKAGEANNQYTRRISLSDLGTPSTPAAQERKGPVGLTTVSVRRASTREEYSVPVEGTALHASIDGDR